MPSPKVFKTAPVPGYPRRWIYSEAKYLKMLAAKPYLPIGVELDHPGGVLETIDRHGDRKGPLKGGQGEAYAESQVACGKYTEVFDHLGTKSTKQIKKEFEDHKAIVYLKDLVREQRETHQAEVAQLKAEIAQLEARLEKQDRRHNRCRTE